MTRRIFVRRKSKSVPLKWSMSKVPHGWAFGGRKSVMDRWQSRILNMLRRMVMLLSSVETAGPRLLSPIHLSNLQPMNRTIKSNKLTTFWRGASLMNYNLESQTLFSARLLPFYPSNHPPQASTIISLLTSALQPSLPPQMP